MSRSNHAPPAEPSFHDRNAPHLQSPVCRMFPNAPWNRNMALPGQWLASSAVTSKVVPPYDTWH